MYSVLNHISNAHGLDKAESCENHVIVNKENLEKLEEIKKDLHRTGPLAAKNRYNIKIEWEQNTGRIKEVKGKCPFCGYSSARPFDLANHIVSQHEKKQPFRKSLKPSLKKNIHKKWMSYGIEFLRSHLKF